MPTTVRCHYDPTCHSKRKLSLWKLFSVTPTDQSSEPRSDGVTAYVARHTTMIAAAVCLMSFAGFWLAQRVGPVSMIDLMVYRAEGWTVRTGGDLYAMVATRARLPATYPPFSALVFVPLTWLDVASMRTFATAANLLLLLGVVYLSLRIIGRPRQLPPAAATFAVSAVAVWCEPVWTTLRYGQINLLLILLVLWDLTRRSGRRWAGVGTGVAAGIKLTPALFAVFLALVGIVQGVRRLRSGRGVWNPALRQALVALGACTATVGLADLALPRDSRTFWGRVVFAASRVGYAEQTANQSVRGVAARLLHTAIPGDSWLLAAAVVGILGLVVAVAAAVADDRLPAAPAWACCACAATALLVSPVSWSHHWVWCVPMVLLLGSEALRRRTMLWGAAAVAGTLLFTSYVVWWVPHGLGRQELHQNVGEMMLSAAYPAGGLAFLLLTGIQVIRALRTPRHHPVAESASEPPHRGGAGDGVRLTRGEAAIEQRARRAGRRP